MAIAIEPLTCGTLDVSPASGEELVEIFKGLPRGQSIRLLANFSALAWNAFGSDDPTAIAVLQQEVLSTLKDAALARAVNHAFKSRSYVLLYPEQAALAVKFAVLYAARPDINSDDIKARASYSTRVLEALLKLSTLMEQEQQRVLAADTLGFALRTGHFQRSERLANLLARYHSFFVWADSSEAQNSSDYLPIASDFQRLLHYSFEGSD